MHSNSSLETICTFLDSISPLNEEDKEALSTIAQTRSLEKGDFLEKVGKQASHLRFVLEGVYRAYHLEEGKEITHYFYTTTRNPIVGVLESLLTNTASKINIECIVPGKVMELSYQDWEKLCRHSFAYNTIARKLAEQHYLLALTRIESLQYQNATDRYALFLQQYPNLIQQISQHYIASYIGVAPESLSRLRKKLLKEP